MKNVVCAWRFGVVVLLVAAGVGCDSHVQCEPNTLAYAGRPPRRLFAYEQQCRDDCFAAPVGTCAESCDEVRVEPLWTMLDDRDLATIGVEEPGRSLFMADASSLGEGRALVFEFGFVDDSGGSDPATWSFPKAGTRGYISGQLDGKARFDISTFVAEVALDCEQSGSCSGQEVCFGPAGQKYCSETCVPTPIDQPDPCSAGRACSPLGTGEYACRMQGETLRIGSFHISTAPTTETMVASPARLDVSEIDENHFAGQFYLAYETVQGQPQGQVQGCFDVDLSDL